ncbi:hypothetical protein HY227_01255 [Candidatus Wolfebacteria bacterium]|nr:hypothetical protein [Candidatus Wolfebacteria bacterium]
MSIETKIGFGLAMAEYKRTLGEITTSVKEREGESAYYRSSTPFGMEFWTREEEKRVKDALGKISKAQEALGVPLEERFCSLFSPLGCCV